MSILVSHCDEQYEGFSKDLFIQVAMNSKITDSVTPPDKEVTVAVYMRTDRGNLMLTHGGEFYTITDVPSLMLTAGWQYQVNALIDAGLVRGKEYILDAFKISSEKALREFATKSTLYPVGAVETPDSYLVAFSVVMSEDLLRDPQFVLNEGYEFTPIETYTPEGDVQREIFKSVILVKSEESKYE